MKQLKRAWKRFSRSQLWRAWQRYGNRRGNRLAGATSFFGFLSLFPLIVLAAAIIGPLLGEKAIETLKETLEKNLPILYDTAEAEGALIKAAG